MVTRISTTLLGAALAVVAAEVYIRPLYSLSVVYEPGIGYVNAPGRARWGIEGLASSTWAAHGIRVIPGRGLEREDPHAKVLVLGDSFTEGLMVGDHEVFPAVTQAALDRQEVKVDLINAGRSTMSAADYVALAPRYRELFGPTWAVTELRSSDLAEDAWAPDRTHFERDLEGRLFAKPIVPPPRAGRSGTVFQLRQESMFLGYGVVRLGRFRAAAQAEPPLFQASQRAPAAPKPPAPPVEEELDLLFQAWENRLTLLFISGTDTNDTTEERVRNYCERHRASCVFTRNSFLDLKARGHEPYGFSNTYLGEGHMNAHGHAVAGRVLAEELTRIRGTITEARR